MSNTFSPPWHFPSPQSEQRASSSDFFRTQNNWLWLTLFVLHVPLGILLNQNEMLATLHALSTFLASVAILTLDSNTDRAIGRAAPLVAYIVGAEVLWRMTDARIFWEYGKYAVVALLGLALIRQSQTIRLHPIPILYFLLLLPSAAFWTGEEWGQIRRQLSFNLSGPFALAVATLFFAQRSDTQRNLNQILIGLIAPTISIASIALYGIMTNPNISFTTEANFAASGGFGPNQVSSILGLGAVACWFLILRAQQAKWFQLTLIILMIWFIIQIFFTFSRTGIYGVVLAVVASVIIIGLHGAERRFGQIALMLIVIGPLTQFLVIPQLNQFTDGMLTQRFTDTNTTGRAEIMQVQLQIWQFNPVFGVGPGKAKDVAQELFGSGTASHTEVTRMLAEHGMLGLGALILLLAGGIWCFVRSAPGLYKAFVAASLVWVLLYVLANGMRTVAPSFVYGMAWSMLQHQNSER